MNKDMDFPWQNERRFNAYSTYFKKQFGERMQKLSIDAGFTCPNRDGKIAYGGCLYCNNRAFNPSYCEPGKSIFQQIEEGILFHEKRYRRATSYLAYFQPYSNTYADLSILREKYEEALRHPKVKGLIIGTRPDCVDEEKLQYLAELSKTYYVVVEYGIESCYNKTLQRINRGHTFEQTAQSIIQTHKLGIKVGGHLIFGLPGETKEEMMKQTAILSSLPIDTLKFHQLQIFKNTVLEKEYREDPAAFHLFSKDEYIEFIIGFIEKLSPAIVIERFAGEVPPRFLVAPQWGNIRYDDILKRIEQLLSEQNTFQGRLFTPEK